MSDFHDAIPEAVAHVQPFVQALDDAQRECKEAMKHIATLRERLRGDRQALDEAVDALEKAAEQLEQDVQPPLAGAAANLGHVREAVASAAQEWEEAFGEEEKALAAGDEMLPGLTESLNEMADKAETASQAVLESVGKATGELAEALALVDGVIQKGLVANLMQPWIGNVEVMTGSLLSFLENDCPEAALSAEAAWRQKVEKVHAMMAEAFEGMATHGHEIASYAAERWYQLFEAQLTEAGTQADALIATLTSLGLEVTNDQGQLEASGSIVSDQQDEIARQATLLEQGFHSVRQLWASSGISS